MAFLISGVAELMHNPGGLWEILILRVFKFIGSYGWRILFFTVCLKLLLFPLDLYQRIKMRKNQLITERIRPQMEKLQQQYAGDRQTLSQKQMELNRREGFSYFSSCLPMIVTLVVFFYLFAGLNNISQYKNLQQYVELYDAYTAVETELKDNEFTVNVGGEEITTSYNKLAGELNALESTKPDINKYKDENGQWGGELGGEADYNAKVGEWEAANLEETISLNRKMTAIEDTHIIAPAQQAVVTKYDEIKESFLWVANIWSPDVPWKKSILSHGSFKNNISGYSSYNKATKKLKIDKSKLDANTFDNMLSEATYNKVMGELRNSSHNRANGFLILPILSVAFSFLSQFITAKLQKQSGQASPDGSSMAGSMKFMMFAMPIIMGIFALQYTAMFTLYIVVNSATTILINVFTTLAMNGKSKRNVKKQTTGIQKYGRPDPKDL